MDDVPWVIKYPTEYMCKKGCYLIDGIEHERVTNINNIVAKPGLMHWYGHVGNSKAKAILQASNEHGSMVHKIIEWILNGIDVDMSNYSQHVQNDIKAWHDDWLGKHDVVAEGTEVHLFDSDLLCAGTSDFIGLVDGKRYIGDWKTSGAIYSSYWMQLGAYAHMFEQLTKLKLDGVFIVRIKDGKIQDEQYVGRQAVENILYPAFSAALEMFISKKRLEEWMKDASG